jgi:hypothetical protein
LLSCALKPWHPRRVRTFCAEMTPNHNPLKTFMIAEYKCHSIRHLAVR